MMTRLNIFLGIALFFYFVVIFFLIRKKSLSLKYSLLWLLCGVLISAVAMFPAKFSDLMRLIGLVNPTNGLLALCIFCLLILLLMLTSILSKMSIKISRLIQTLGIAEKRIRDLENEINSEIKTHN